MPTNIFVNLPVKDLQRSIEFFSKLGYTFNKQFTDATATCMIISENIFVMLLTREKFKMFTPKEVSDASKTSEVLICLSQDSREAVKDLVGKALAAGGKRLREPQDHGFMHAENFEDLDGHIWEIIWRYAGAVGKD